jgi:hypothetical protein
VKEAKNKINKMAKLVKPKIAGGVVRVTVPAAAAYDLKKMNTITQKILSKLGCPGCHSGYDIRFDIEGLRYKANIAGAIKNLR